MVESPGARIGRAARRALADDATFAVALFLTSVLVNGTLAILFIELLRALGMWVTPEEASMAEAAEGWRAALVAQADQVHRPR